MTGRILTMSLCLIIGVNMRTYAYIGPGVGVTLIGWIAGFALATAAALWAVIAWPVRQIFARRKIRRAKMKDESSNSETDSDYPSKL